MVNLKVRPELLWASITTLLIFLPLFLPLGIAIYYDASVIYDRFFTETLAGDIYGVNTEWIYPVAAQIPILIAGFMGLILGSFLSGWLLLVSALNFFTVYVTVKHFSLTHKQLAVSLIFIIPLTSIFYYRLDFIAICLTIIAVTIHSRNKTLAYIILTVAVFIKIWPLAFIAVLWLMSSSKVKDITIVIVSTLTILTPSIIFGGLGTAFSFIIRQDGRGIQAESLFAIPLLLQGGGAARNIESLSFEVEGAGSGLMSTLSTVILVITLLTVLTLGFTKYWKKPALPNEAYLLGNVIIIVFILFNKVGSTQFVAWLILLLLFTHIYVQPENMKNFVLTAAASTVAAGQMYPYLTDDLLAGGLMSIIMLSLKYFMMLALLALSIKTYIDNSKSNKFMGEVEQKL